MLVFLENEAYQVSLTTQPGVVPIVVRGAGIQWSCLVSDGFADDTPILNCPSRPKCHAHEYTPILHVTLPSCNRIRALTEFRNLASLTLVARPGVVQGS